MDWNDQKYGEIWRQGWAATANRYLEANGRPERLDLRSYERQGLDKIPTVHMGPAVSQMEKRGIQTNIGNLNRDIKAANSLMQSIRQMVRHLIGWIADLKEKKAALLEALQESKEPTLPELLGKYLDLRREDVQAGQAKASLQAALPISTRLWKLSAICGKRSCPLCRVWTLIWIPSAGRPFPSGQR